MAQFINFGSGSDGLGTLSGTFSPVDSSCSGTGNGTNKDLSATNASFAAGKMILIHQTRGTGVGAWEINQIESYVAGTITCTYPLANTYTDSGASQAQVLILNEYSSVTVSGTLTAKSWDGNVGGIIAFLCTGRVTTSGTISANGNSAGSGNESAPTGAGFGGGARATGGGGQSSAQGEGSVAAGGGISTAANGSGGGGATKSDAAYAGGGGGVHNGSGADGTKSIVSGSATAGTGGSGVGSSALNEIHFGGGGGGGVKDNSTDAGCGGAGAGIILIFAREIVITGSITAVGGNGGHVGATNHGGGGGGGGGTIFLKGETIDYSSGTITVAGGSAGNAAGGGAVGRIRIEACSRTGSVLDAESIGGYSFCSSYTQIF